MKEKLFCELEKLKIGEKSTRLFNYWADFLLNRVDFTLEDTLIHGHNHSMRVLLFSIVLGMKLDLSDNLLNALCIGSVFHDCRRFDDGTDVGHGMRGANRYREYCRENSMDFNPIAYYAIYYHDRNDTIGEEIILRDLENPSDGITVYRVFKDADALDRLRFGIEWLDVKMLRTEESLKLLDFASKINTITP